MAWVKVVTECLVTAYLVFWMNRCFGPFGKPLPLKQLKVMMRQAWPFAGYPVLRGIALGTDLILLSFFVSTTAVGLYTGASKIFFVFLTLSGAYVSVIYPRMASVMGQSVKVLHIELFRLFRVVMPIALLGMLLVLFLSDFVLVQLFGEEFYVASSSLQMLVVAFLSNLASRHYRVLLLVSQQQKLDLTLVSISTFVHLSVKLIMIPIWGIEGAAIGTAIGEISLLLLYMVATHRLHRKTIGDKFNIDK